MLCTFVLDAGHKVRFDSIVDQNWDDFELIYVQPRPSSNPDKGGNASKHEHLLQQRFCRFVDYHDENQWSAIIAESQGMYMAWLHPCESWGKGYLDNLREILHKNVDKRYDEVVAGYGFYQNTATSLTFIGTKYPQLLKENTLAHNISRPLFYNPFIKYFFVTGIIRHYSIPLNYSIPNWRERYAVFCLTYILAFKSSIGGRQPPIDSTTMLFSLPQQAILDTNSFQEYLSMIHGEKENIIGSPFEKSFWIYGAIEAVRGIKKLLSLYPKK